MTSLKIQGLGGAHTLKGEIAVAGAKNAVLKAMASTLLFEDQVTLENVPEIEDVLRVGELLSDLGATVETPKENVRTIDTSGVSKTVLTPEISGRMRGSIVVTGPLLARAHTVSFPNPGGCNLGARPIDLFLEGFRALGATVREEEDMYVVEAPNGLRGAEFFFRIVSHTGTETLMMAAVRAKGTTVLKNCALEPEVKSLADFLNSCGAKISGAGTSTITIEGVDEPLKAGKHVYKTMPDRIEATSFLVLGALCAEELTVTGVDTSHIEMTLALLSAMGVAYSIDGTNVTVRAPETLHAVNIRTHEYPGLATDVQPQFGVMLTQCEGESTIFETIFENRLGYLADLSRMGAHIEVEDHHRARIAGKAKLFGTELVAPDLRAGLAFIIAALVAEGESVIKNAYNIDRGYEHIEKRLRGIGVVIDRAE